MGRMRIKKKDVAIPFRETVLYRMILLSASIVFLLFAIYRIIVAMMAFDTPGLILGFVLGAAGAYAVFYNVDHLRHARLPARTAKRMRRR